MQKTAGGEDKEQTDDYDDDDNEDEPDEAPLHVLPLYSNLPPAKQAKVRMCRTHCIAQAARCLKAYQRERACVSWPPTSPRRH